MTSTNKIDEKTYLSIPELAKRWGCSKNFKNGGRLLKQMLTKSMCVEKKLPCEWKRPTLFPESVEFIHTLFNIYYDS